MSNDGPRRERPPGTEVLRTPEVRFTRLAGYPFEPRYASVRAAGVDALRMHYVDAGPPDGPVVLLLHGQPTWSYLYRTVIPVLTARGFRTVAPDNIGFGRSDKPTDRTLYTYRRHVQWTTSLVEGLDLRDVTLVVQDWGGPLGLSALAAVPERFARVVATNTALHTSDPTLAGKLTWANHGTGDGRVVLEESLLDYVQYCQRAPELVASTFVYAASKTLAPEVLSAYDAPFPDQTLHRRDATDDRPHPDHTPTIPGRASGAPRWRRSGASNDRFSPPSPMVTPPPGGGRSVLQETVPGAAGREHPTIRGAGHFVPEERGEELGKIVADFAATTATPP